ncbi:hypothetical protein [Streptomyces sp. 35G-GA-8]|uniref:hypothetical protein n=1 Tax=Streptomyces sp. 35G-GA-8 TaxID=2939434 RepID=UPI00201F4C98|nr:hypothetical protein [Streptomyces sp. 35G-GA-8]MCL7380515.1 hypothetical protein [Streptomyces sp. 35G-GA-8]
MGAEPDVHTLADYLQEPAAPLRGSAVPPSSFWAAIARQARTPDELCLIGLEAGRLGFDAQAEQLFARAVEVSGHAEALWQLARYWELEYTDDWNSLTEVWQMAAQAGRRIPDWVPKEPTRKSERQ